MAAGMALVLLPPSPRAAELGGEDSCSRADAHASQSHDGATTRVETAEAALAVEATRPLPAFTTLGDEAAAPVAGTNATASARDGDALTDGERESVGPHLPPGWVPPRDTPSTGGLLDASPDADRLEAVAPAPLGFRDSAAPRERMRDLKRLRELKLLRLFDTRQLMVWFGLDRKGRPGLHFRQRNPGEEMPPATQSAFLADPPPLRSVPLTSP